MSRLFVVGRVTIATLVATVAVLFASGLQPAPAMADNCQAEELITKTVFPPGHPLYESPAGDESEDLRCVVLKYYGCENAAAVGACASGIIDAVVWENYPYWINCETLNICMRK